MDRHSLIVLVFVFIALPLGCAKEIPDPGGETIDFESPKSVVSHVFWAARTGRASGLASLCDPQGGGNAAVQRVCTVSADSPDWQSFRDNFAKGKLNGEPRVAGDNAVLKFLYGPNGSNPETMKLARRNGRWYLESF